MANPTSSAIRESTPTPQLGSRIDGGADGEPNVQTSHRLFATVTEALKLGRRFSVCHLLELQHSATGSGVSLGHRS